MIDQNASLDVTHLLQLVLYQLTVVISQLQMNMHTNHPIYKSDRQTESQKRRQRRKRMVASIVMRTSIHPPASAEDATAAYILTSDDVTATAPARLQHQRSQHQHNHSTSAVSNSTTTTTAPTQPACHQTDQPSNPCLFLDARDVSEYTPFAATAAAAAHPEDGLSEHDDNEYEGFMYDDLFTYQEEEESSCSERGENEHDSAQPANSPELACSTELDEVSQWFAGTDKRRYTSDRERLRDTIQMQTIVLRRVKEGEGESKQTQIWEPMLAKAQKLLEIGTEKECEIQHFVLMGRMKQVGVMRQQVRDSVETVE